MRRALQSSVATLCAAAALLLCVPDASAQYYSPYHQPRRARSRWGFRHRIHGYIGGQLSGFVVAAQSTDYTDGYLGHGGGGGLFGGVRLGPFFSIEGNWGITYHDNTVDQGDVVYVDLDAIYLMSFTVDGKVHIPTYGPVEPYFQAGVGYSYIGATYGGGYHGDSVFASGPTFNLGGGLDVWLSPWFTVGGRLLYKGLYFGDPSYDVGPRYANYVSGVNIDVNAAFHF